MPRSINLTGTPGREYDLEQISTTNTRTDATQALVVQIWHWNPNGIESYKNDQTKYEAHKKPNPPDLKLGQIWLSKYVPTDFIEEV